MNKQPVLGFFFALIAAMAWGSLPIALKQLLTVMDAQTIVWFRFSVAAIGLCCLLFFSKNFPRIRLFSKSSIGLILLGIAGLAANFILYNSALSYIQPTTSQVLGQISPFIMMIFGVILFKEVMGLHQKIGLIILIIGLIFFFNDRFAEILAFNDYSFGIFLGLSASVVWVAYGISQKLLLAKYSSSQILFIFYCGCTLLFTPLATISQVVKLDSFTLGCLVFCCMNTLVGYGAYAEALNRWDVSKVSVVATLIPLFTILFSELSHLVDPQHFAMPELNVISYIGACVVVFGAIFSAVGHKLIYRNQLRNKFNK